MIRVRLLKQYKFEYAARPWPVGQIVQCSSQLASDLIREKIAELYTGEYPPKTKKKIELKNLNKK